MVELWRLAETDLSSVGGPVEGFAWDCIIQEIDIVTDELLFEWRALDHVPVDETYYEITGDMGSWPKERAFFAPWTRLPKLMPNLLHTAFD